MEAAADGRVRQRVRADQKTRSRRRRPDAPAGPRSADRAARGLRRRAHGRTRSAGRRCDRCPSAARRSSASRRCSARGAPITWARTRPRRRRGRWAATCAASTSRRTGCSTRARRSTPRARPGAGAGGRRRPAAGLGGARPAPRLDADLVTLSACESGAGTRGDGARRLIGLSRAFQDAGARSVLASLWAISDRSTAPFMESFYRRVRAGAARDIALQEAQVASLREARIRTTGRRSSSQATGDEARLRAAVTGATGFIGRHLLGALRRRGWAPPALVRRKEAEGPLPRRRLGRGAGRPGERRRAARADGLRRRRVPRRGPHDPAAGTTWSASTSPARSASGRRAHRAAAARMRLRLFAGGQRASRPGQPLESTERSAPVSAYGLSKADGEKAVMESGVPFTILRPPTVYGPWDRELLRRLPLGAQGTVPMVRGRQPGPPAPLTRPTWPTRWSPRPSGPPRSTGTYHVAHPDVVIQRELLKAIASSLGRRVNLFPVPPPFVRAPCSRSAGGRAGCRDSVPLLSGDRASELLAPAWTCLAGDLEARRALVGADAARGRPSRHRGVVPRSPAGSSRAGCPDRRARGNMAGPSAGA